MLVVRIDIDNYSYDIHSLVKAFYPAEDVLVYVEGEKDLHSGELLPELFISMGSKRLQLTLTPSNLVPSPRIACDRAIEIPDGTDRAGYKNILKHQLYGLLSDYTGRTLPWGNLTGIRPTKIASKLIADGATDGDVLTYMSDVYRCSEEKSKLALEIAQTEQRILQERDYTSGYSLYIGVPFCPSTCLYCSFTSYPIASARTLVRDYIEALKKEIDWVAEYPKRLDTIYIGGGTPTTLEAEELREVIEYLKSKLDMSAVKEFTVEAGRADSISGEKLETLRELGVSRISVNPQTMNDETLKFIGRKATAAATVEAYKLAREVGFDNINMDLIVGLPGEDIDDVRNTLEKVSELRPDSLTVHSLAIKRASALAQKIDEVGYETLKNSDEIMNMCYSYASDMGMSPYYLYRQKNMSGNMENVGYSREGKAGLYNILIMEEVQSIVAIGAGTVSKRVYPDGRIERCDTVKDIALYISNIEDMIERKRKLFED